MQIGLFTEYSLTTNCVAESEYASTSLSRLRKKYRGVIAHHLSATILKFHSEKVTNRSYVRTKSGGLSLVVLCDILALDEQWHASG